MDRKLSESSVHRCYEGKLRTPDCKVDAYVNGKRCKVDAWRGRSGHRWVRAEHAAGAIRVKIEGKRKYIDRQLASMDRILTLIEAGASPESIAILEGP